MKLLRISILSSKKPAGEDRSEMRKMLAEKGKGGARRYVWFDSCTYPHPIAIHHSTIPLLGVAMFLKGALEAMPGGYGGHTSFCSLFTWAEEAKKIRVLFS